MHRSEHLFTRIYVLIAVLTLLADVLTGTVSYLYWGIKPCIMLSLGVYAWLRLGSLNSRFAVALMLAILASLAGDVLLMGGDAYFVGGLAAFLLAHVAYIYVFLRSHQNASEPGMLRRRPWLALAFVAYGGLLVMVLWPSLGSLWLPVCVYALVITLMALAALNRWQRVPHRSFTWVFLGALLFVVSDSLIALDKFSLEIPWAHGWIMLTYMAAQYLIVMGLLRGWVQGNKQLASEAGRKLGVNHG